MTYSQDLRLGVIAAVRAKPQSLSQIAHLFGVSESTVDKWAKRWRTTRRVAALPWAGGVQHRLRTCAAAIRDEVKKQPDATLAELCQRVKTVTAIAADPSLTPAPTAGAV